MLTSFQKTWRSLSLGQRAALGAVLALVFAGVLWVAQTAGHPPYAVLFSNLEPEDAGAVTSKLREMKVDYQLSDGGHAIEVPADKVYDLRLTMATAGLPRGGNVGFELFDKTSFGATDFTQHLNYQRALQGELTRTINQLDGVLDSRVHLAMPEKQLFSETQDPVTASVVLHLRPGYQPEDRQVAGIIHLVSAAVQGLKAQNVSIHNAQGDLLSSGGSGSVYTESQLQLQEQYERRLETQLQRLVEQVLGPGRAAIRVSADLNWDQTETTSETFQPSGAKGGNLPQEEETTTETYGRGAPRPPRGIPGAASNLSIPPAVPPAADPAAAGQYTNQHASNKYVVNKVVERRVAAPGKIRRLSIAVLLDQSISPAQQRALKGVLAAAAGLDLELPAKGGRGDKIELLPLAFDKTAAAAETRAADTAAKQSFKVVLTRNGAAVLVVLLVALASLFLAKQLFSSPREPLDILIDEPVSPSGPAAPRETRLDLRAASGAGAAAGAPAPAAERTRLLASQRPDEVARQLQSWMAE
jgi:flagellar M-ring protein FliF